MIIGVRDDYTEDALNSFALQQKAAGEMMMMRRIKGKIGPAGQILMTTDENHNTILHHHHSQ